jgi:hypothetical protein
VTATDLPAADADLPLTRDPFARTPRHDLLLGSGDAAWFRDRWRELERAYGTEPESALAGADELARQVLERLALTLRAERGGQADLARYRVFFERVLVA